MYLIELCIRFISIIKDRFRKEMEIIISEMELSSFKRIVV